MRGHKQQLPKNAAKELRLQLAGGILWAEGSRAELPRDFLHRPCPSRV